MGFRPTDVDAMGLWEFNACVSGYRAAHSGGRAKPRAAPMSETALAALMARADARSAELQHGGK